MSPLPVPDPLARLDVEIKRLDELRGADTLAVAAALAAAKEAVSAALISSEKAISKAEQSQLRVNETQNEFRGQLKDQAATMATRETLESLEASVLRQLDELRSLVATEREERRSVEGVRRGMSATTAIIVTAIGVVGTVLGIIIVAANVLTNAP